MDHPQAPPAPGPVVLELEDVNKSFGAVAALRGARLELRGGEAHALVGENGAGKSTLVKILAGVHGPDTGRVLLDGAPITLDNPAAARAAGIAVIYQEPTPFPDLPVAENIFMGRQPLHGGRWIDRRELAARCRGLFERLGVHLDPERPARGLSIADQQMVEIAKALSFDARVLVMDEPTAALSGVEVERLFTVARSLRANGAAVLFISHRFDEVFDLCDRITVMRDGQWVSTDPTADLTVDQVVRRMVGREVASLFPKLDVEPGEVLLEVRELTRRGVFADVSFDVRAGEIVALAGLVGAGRSEVVRAVFGIDGYDGGAVRGGGGGGVGQGGRGGGVGGGGGKGPRRGGPGAGGGGGRGPLPGAPPRGGPLIAVGGGAHPPAPPPLEAFPPGPALRPPRARH